MNAIYEIVVPCYLSKVGEEAGKSKDYADNDCWNREEDADYYACSHCNKSLLVVVELEKCRILESTISCEMVSILIRFTCMFLESNKSGSCCCVDLEEEF